MADRDFTDPTSIRHLLGTGWVHSMTRQSDRIQLENRIRQWMGGVAKIIRVERMNISVVDNIIERGVVEEGVGVLL